MNKRDPIVWIVLFESEPPRGDYAPVVPYLPTSPFLHGLDPDVASALGAIWACLHLPRAFTDTFDVDYSVMEKSTLLDIPHVILPLPLGLLRSSPAQVRVPSNVMLVVCPDETVREVEALAKGWHPERGVIGYSGLDQSALDQCWEAVANLSGPRGTRRFGPPLTDMTPGCVERLALLHRIRQYCPPDRRADIGCDPVREELIREALGAARHASAVAALERAGCSPAEFEHRYAEAVKEALPRWHLAVGSPGAPSTLRKAALDKRNAPPADFRASSIADERHAVDVMVAHRAVARGGFGMTLPDVPDAAFRLLEQLEAAAGAPRVRAWSVQKAFNRIGRMLGGLLSQEQAWALRSSKSVTAFTDFPWGLAVLPGDTAPLATCTPVMYRPLTPMTRALQWELTSPPAVYLADGFSVLIAECLEEGDPIRAMSERAWRDQANRLNTKGGGRIDCVFRVMAGMEELDAALNERDYDVLVISAHGIQHPSGRVAGLRIGKDDVYDFGRALPPVVVLSACSVWPRGSGAISVADLALRHGARAIIGTLAPIRVTHHEFVATRIFVYMVESLLGREPETNLAEVVQRALSTNAVLDAVHGAKRLRRWAFDRGAKPLSPIEEFMLHRSSGQLRTGHIYADTERVLSEMAAAENPHLGRSVSQFFRGGSYVPESLFYVMVGWPEKIVLQARAPEEVAARARRSSHS